MTDFTMCNIVHGFTIKAQRCASPLSLYFLTPQKMTLVSLICETRGQGKGRKSWSTSGFLLQPLTSAILHAQLTIGVASKG